MLVVFTGLTVLLGLHYAAMMGLFARGFRRVRRAPEGQGSASNAEAPFVSVVIPARNEEAGIGACVEAVLANRYPADRFEVLVADDGSTDDTARIVRRLQHRYDRAAVPAGGVAEEAPPRLRLLPVPADPARTQAHKKYALTHAIAHARGDVILTTDADCTVPPTWIGTMAGCFDADTGFVSGPVLYRPGRTRFGHLQALEFLGLVAVGAGSIGLGRPTLCNGANAAYRRDVFDAVGGFAGIDHLTAGDDELLMRKIAYGTPWQVRFCAATSAAVHTDPAPSVAAFFQQRRRWASLGPHYERPGLVAMLVAFYAFYVLLLAGGLAAPFVAGLWLPLLAGLGLKAVGEAALLLPACRHFGRTWLMRYFLPEQLLQIPYLVLVVPAGVLGGYTWKARVITR